MKKLFKALKRLGFFLLALYAGLSFAACAFADNIVFPAPPPSYKDGPDVIKLKCPDGVEISAMHFPSPGAKRTILYTHGNAEDIGQLSDLFKRMNAAGLSVFAYDWHGYGTSQGKASEKNCYMDIGAAWDYLTRRLGVAPEEIMIYGRSLGAGPSIWLASKVNAGGLVVEGGFKTAFSVVTGSRILPFDMFPNIDRIGKVKCPCLFMHGEKDGVIPFSHGKALYAAAPEPKRYFWVESAEHNDFVWTAGDEYFEELKKFDTTLDNKEKGK